MKQIWIRRAFGGMTTIYEVEIEENSIYILNVGVKHQLTDDEIELSLRLYSNNQPIFVERGHPELEDLLIKKGYWVLK